MAKFQFGNSSTEKLNSCTPVLQRVVRRALRFGVMDFSVTEGHRSLERQNELFLANKTTIDGVTQMGKHNHSPSLAVDLMPWPGVVNGVSVWDDKQRFCVLAGLMFAAAAEEGVSIRMGS